MLFPPSQEMGVVCDPKKIQKPEPLKLVAGRIAVNHEPYHIYNIYMTYHDLIAKYPKLVSHVATMSRPVCIANAGIRRSLSLGSCNMSLYKEKSPTQQSVQQFMMFSNSVLLWLTSHVWLLSSAKQLLASRTDLLTSTS